MALSEHLEKLRHFRQLVDYQSIRQGAEAMRISQAGLSKSISALEAVLETQLFIRSKDGLTLTKEGLEVLKSADRILLESAQLETKLRSLKTLSVPKKLRVGMYDSIAVYFFSDLSSYMKELYPTVSMELTVDSSDFLFKAIQEGSLDLAVGVNWESKRDRRVRYYKLFDDHYSFYASPRLKSRRDHAPLLIHARADDRDRMSIESHLKTLIKERGVHQVFNFETLKTLTLQGLGIGVLPTQVAKPFVKNGQLVPAQIQKTRQLFGPHTIGFLATHQLSDEHRSFCEDIYRLGERWSKS